jgi:hypothetical protein
MPCPKTPHLAIEYFDDKLSQIAREELDRHLLSCTECAAEVEGLKGLEQKLGTWKDEQVPHWDRGKGLYQQEHGKAVIRPQWLWHWLPTAASLAMFVVMLFGMNISTNSDGFVVAFGAANQGLGSEQITQLFAEYSNDQQARQDQALQTFLARMDERQDSNNSLLLQAVSDLTRQLTAENFDRIYTYFEQQRLLDLENVQVSYQHLADSDFETFQSMQQLANFVRFPADSR